MGVHSGERTMLLRAAPAESSTFLRQASTDSPLFRRNIFVPGLGCCHGPLSIIDDVDRCLNVRRVRCTRRHAFK